MLNFAINNETAEVARPLPFLTDNPIYKGDRIMAETNISETSKYCKGRTNLYQDFEVDYLKSHCAEMPYKDIGEVLGRSDQSVRMKAFDLKLDGNHTKKHVNDNFFSIPNNLNCYWAGFLAADGYIKLDRATVSLDLSSKDREQVYQFKDDVGFDGNIYEYSRTSRLNGKGYPTTSSIMRVHSQQWIDDLDDNFNIRGLKADGRFNPELTKTPHILAFLIGLIDGDGSLWINNSTVKGKVYPRTVLNFIGPKPLMEWVKDCVLRWGTSAHATRQPAIIKRRKNCWEYRVYGKRADTMVKKLWEVDVPRLSRKWDNFKEA
jgi:hypothetical protein